MNAFQKGYIARLKEIVVNNFTGEEILSSDCYKLSFDIQNKTNKRVSETTLKRFFGFTSSLHNPSQYTLNAICRYCGFHSWENFKEHVDQETVENSIDKEWQEVKSTLIRTTEWNVTMAKRRLLNWDLEKVDTNSIKDCIERFESSPHNLMIIHAAADMGKTNRMVHWISESLESSENQTILYLDSLSLFQSSVYGYDAYRWLANIMEFPTSRSIRNFLSAYEESAPGYLHIIIDGFNEEIFAEKQYYTVVNNLTEMISAHKSCEWLKFSLILRTNIYEKLKRKVIKSIQQEWYMDDSYLNENTLKYNTKSISTTLNSYQIDHSLNRLASSSIYEWMKFPRFLHWFIERKKRKTLTDFGDHELKFLYIHHFFQSNPQLLSLLDRVDDLIFENIVLKIPYKERYKINKSSLSWSNAKFGILHSLELYHELLGHGIIEIDPESSPNQVCFIFPEYKAYLIAFELFYHRNKHNVQQFKHTLYSLMDQDPAIERSSTIFYLLFSLEESPYDSLTENIGLLNLLGDDIWYLLSVFTFEIYQENDQFIKESIQKAIEQNSLINKIIYQSNLPYPNLRKVLLLFMEMVDDESQLFQLRLKLATFAFMRWDEDEFIRQLESMSVLASRTEGEWSVQVVEGLSALYNYIRYKKVNRNDIAQIININYSNNLKNHPKENELSFEFVGYLLIILSRSSDLAENYLKTIQLKLGLIHDKDSLVYIIYYLLEKLIKSHATREAPPLDDAIHSSYVKEFSNNEKPNFLQIITYIIAFHYELAANNDHVVHYKRSQEIESLLEPLGYRLLTRYFAMIFFANK